MSVRAPAGQALDMCTRPTFRPPRTGDIYSGVDKWSLDLGFRRGLLTSSGQGISSGDRGTED